LGAGALSGDTVAGNGPVVKVSFLRREGGIAGGITIGKVRLRLAGVQLIIDY
jgi:hypothetical protein